MTFRPTCTLSGNLREVHRVKTTWYAAATRPLSSPHAHLIDFQTGPGNMRHDGITPDHFPGAYRWGGGGMGNKRSEKRGEKNII